MKKWRMSLGLVAGLLLVLVLPVMAVEHHFDVNGQWFGQFADLSSLKVSIAGVGSANLFTTITDPGGGPVLVDGFSIASLTGFQLNQLSDITQGVLLARDWSLAFGFAQMSTSVLDSFISMIGVGQGTWSTWSETIKNQDLAGSLIQLWMQLNGIMGVVVTDTQEPTPIILRVDLIGFQIQSGSLVVLAKNTGDVDLENYAEFICGAIEDPSWGIPDSTVMLPWKQTIQCQNNPDTPKDDRILRVGETGVYVFPLPTSMVMPPESMSFLGLVPTEYREHEGVLTVFDILHYQHAMFYTGWKDPDSSSGVDQHYLVFLGRVGGVSITPNIIIPIPQAPPAG